MQFLPLDKYMYLKAHCFVNLVETTYRSVRHECQGVHYSNSVLCSNTQKHSTYCFPLWRSAGLVSHTNTIREEKEGREGGINGR